MIKYIFFTVILLSLSISANAQNAKELLDQVSNSYSKIPTYYIKFEVKESGNSKGEIGEVYASKEKYNLNVMGINQIYDGKTLYTISKEDKEVTVSIPTKDSDDLLTPVKILGMYKTGYKYELEKTSTIDGNKIQFIKLTPTGNSDVKSISVGINTNNKTLYQYKETNKNGGTRTITVKDYLENLIIPKPLFKFDKSKYESDGYIVTQI
ncbi:LolA family protein [Moheibacter sediminis]|uniref:Outer membrane lipoprotein-sorting protein n=1 Tax=Moheibacter sediminis TaxID=1434700 RepID=A0A1W1ZUF2_9FLAO|nr:outer membrane lipoprotein carrier protein LolA [Moheibacter sediminis]SMC51731.1 Outer membrane lipoprotein-sorting protein [Moheibacter sediminis]